MSLLHEIGQAIADGIRRKAITTASKWAERYRIMGGDESGPWSFKYRPWLRGMHDSEAERNIGQKSAQMGYTETLLNLTMFAVDVKRWDVLYVLPAKTPDASDFSSGRFNPAIELSPHLTKMFSDVQNVGHKRSGAVNIYIRGSKSRNGLKGLPVGFIALDEVEEFPEANIPLALERASGRQEWRAWLISTPSIADRGINKYYNLSTKEVFTFKCPACSKFTDLSFPECLKITADDPSDPDLQKSHLLCKECKTKLDHETKWEWLADGKWIPSNSNATDRGFHVNRLYSSAAMARPPEIAKAYLLGLRDPSEATEFWNSKMGLTYEDAGARVTETDIIRRIESYRNGGFRPSGLITVGVDVGKELHYVVHQWDIGQYPGLDVNSGAHCRVLKIDKCLNWSDLDRVMQQWGPHMCVVDANPSMREALQFANRFFGLVRLCIYARGITGKDVVTSKTEEHTVLVNRTSWMDMSLSRFKRDGMIMLPSDTPFEYKSHIQTPVRIYRKDNNGNNVGYYESADKSDHYAHSHTYAEIALKLVNFSGPNKNIASPV